MKLVQISSIMLLAGAQSIHAQMESQNGSVGVHPYVQPSMATYRILFGEGGNAGLGTQTPQTTIGLGSYQTGPNVISAGFLTSSGSSGNPRKTYDEFDLMYGLAFDEILQSYSRPSNQFHASISTGISLDDFSTRWRRNMPPQFNGYTFYIAPPSTSEIALGLPVQLQAIYEPFRYAGIGIILFSNFSRLQPSYGGAAILELRY